MCAKPYIPDPENASDFRLSPMYYSLFLGFLNSSLSLSKFAEYCNFDLYSLRKRLILTCNCLFDLSLLNDSIGFFYTEDVFWIKKHSRTVLKAITTFYYSQQPIPATIRKEPIPTKIRLSQPSLPYHDSIVSFQTLNDVDNNQWQTGIFSKPEQGFFVGEEPKYSFVSAFDVVHWKPCLPENA